MLRTMSTFFYAISILLPPRRLSRRIWIGNTNHSLLPYMFSPVYLALYSYCYSRLPLYDS